HFDFSTDDGGFSDGGGGSTCIDPSMVPDGGGGPMMPPGDGGLPPRAGGPRDGGAPVGPAGGMTIGQVLIGVVPNWDGKFADQRMPDVAVSGPVASLDDFARTQPLGTNGRHCETCHGDQEGWSTTPASFQERFDDGITYLTAACSVRAA